MNIKKNDKILITYLVDNKVNFLIGNIIKIRKNTFIIKKKYLNMYVKNIFFIKNPNFISLKKIK
ncbi:hypothetical protein [Candidatus Carsonella ruddii]|uniref:Putative ribosomal protein L19 n=1 Tax=Candidatus Carsonella ruddii PC isolate NHV TaxID=1202540 RepID=J3Z263_CARRU|nr:hypothetical protein [Candidatus Carsonella ruddii]AFP84349.1 putative ribosomal protein L19 [Candidatus Carsonella ruddii PC isolate NHV]